MLIWKAIQNEPLWPELLSKYLPTVNEENHEIREVTVIAGIVTVQLANEIRGHDR